MLSRLLMAALVVVLLAAPVWAQEQQQVEYGAEGHAPAMSFLGPTGLIITPNADVIGANRWAVGYHYIGEDVAWTNIGGPWHSGTINFNLPKANIGIGNAIEVGATGYLVDFPWDDSESKAIVNAKWRFLNDQKNQLRLAVGVMDIFDQVGINWYVAATKGFGTNRTIADLTVGYMFGDDDSLLENSVFASVNWHALRCLDVMGEVTDNDFNYGLRYWPWKSVNVDVAILDGGNFGAGVAYTGKF